MILSWSIAFEFSTCWLCFRLGKEWHFQQLIWSQHEHMICGGLGRSELGRSELRCRRVLHGIEECVEKQAHLFTSSRWYRFNLLFVSQFPTEDHENTPRICQQKNTASIQPLLFQAVHQYLSWYYTGEKTMGTHKTHGLGRPMGWFWLAKTQPMGFNLTY